MSDQGASSEVKRRKRKAFDPKGATPSTPLKMEWLAKYLGLGKGAIYRAIQRGYRVEFPRLKMTTARHFLDWASQGEAPDSPEMKDRRAEEAARILAGSARN